MRPAPITPHAGDIAVLMAVAVLVGLLLGLSFDRVARRHVYASAMMIAALLALLAVSGLAG
jgi:branched-subunit amino acid ABC-type transport system permease component